MGDNKGKTVQHAASASKGSLVKEPSDAEKTQQIGNAVNHLLKPVNDLKTFNGIKANSAEGFQGKRSILRGYLTSMDMHIRINNLNEA
jgi:hypothetical protein